ncbi:hypothetical protein BFJ63_vAg3310 [Fusarium oxysporum f. sp. narcissi]|uniref:Uncharacterized protein n=4 Tax=Fusarium oxysporum TaxID=5507 RepID=A0A0J9UIQ4_FUSO4|nr:hypothetical protein FOXG_02485 [Fusarium oxysporum f. sp. lycopersici 4287]XP_054559655.1 uncharacterized protein FOBCDRAFT_270467 [Fusarium oxysporum Fo47]RKK84198.1 hypothetical protein BFJ71_g14630 [Fusarium oxysporum]RYC94013.1 hypothetical protein BFJ63_vAg3310 [Fusarium oxysporum f. sp. narcissi]EWZ43600.1 hypothetical protein FOZG_04691 [Fusarium oxysporum Fo47]KNA98035.1 hypothetical protein FOXG_02485 [Fusarium oxysporum f. sp. lycopersici 4287]QKD50666.1 hypothetical protein FOB
MSINFLGDNSTTIALGAKVKDIKFKYTNGKEATIAEGEKANLEGEAYEAYVTYNNGVVKAFTVSAGFVFPKNALATVEFSIAQTTISVISEKGVGGELKLVAGV